MSAAQPVARNVPQSKSYSPLIFVTNHRIVRSNCFNRSPLRFLPGRGVKESTIWADNLQGIARVYESRYVFHHNWLKCDGTLQTGVDHDWKSSQRAAGRGLPPADTHGLHRYRGAFAWNDCSDNKGRGKPCSAKDAASSFTQSFSGERGSVGFALLTSDGPRKPVVATRRIPE